MEVLEGTGRFDNHFEVALIAKTHFGREHEQIRVWTSQLYTEFDQICYQYRLRLRKPVIRVLEMNGKWGLWDINTRTISISRQLIQLGQWDATIEVLKHEIAHMIVHEEMGLNDPTHGDPFKAACKKLGIASWASASDADLMERQPGGRPPSDPSESKLLRRAQKLLALAGSSNEHEAFLAMERVRELYSRHNLERLRTQGEFDDFTYVLINHKKKKAPQHQALIASILNSHFFVETVFGELYDAQLNERHRTLEIVGTSQNVQMAEYVYHFLHASVESLWQSYKKSEGVHGCLKRTFYLGVLQGFDEKLAKQSDYTSPSGQHWKAGSEPLDRD